jgi:hypothetical protein
MPEDKRKDNKLMLVLVGLAILTVVCLIAGVYGWSYISDLLAGRTDSVRP